jgi:hypothetical protein
LKPAVLKTLLPPSSYLFSVGYPPQHWPPLGYSGTFGSEYATGNATKVSVSQPRSPYSDVADVFGRIHEHVKLTWPELIKISRTRHTFRQFLLFIVLSYCLLNLRPRHRISIVEMCRSNSFRIPIDIQLNDLYTSDTIELFVAHLGCG